MADRTYLQLALQQMDFARQYTLGMLEDLQHDDWFRQPSEGVTHVAWQVGHLAMAQYGLCLFRIRGRQPVDAELMSSAFRKQFSKGSTPDPDPASNPAPEDIRRVLDRVHRQVMQELPEYTDQQLQEKIDPPHAVFDTKLGAVLFCPAHEMLHAGQIGLLRRLIGKPPLR